MGRGRTTTGMVIATLVYLNRIGASGNVFLTYVKRYFCFTFICFWLCLHNVFDITLDYLYDFQIHPFL